MVDGINNAHGITPQSGKTVKKQEQTAQKDSASIFSHKGSISGEVSGNARGFINIPVTSQVWENGILVSEIEGTVEYSGTTNVNGVVSGESDIELGRIGQAALEGGLKGALDE